MFHRARARRDAGNRRHLWRGRGSGERFAQGEPGLQSDLRAAHRRHDGTRRAGTCRGRLSRGSRNGCSGFCCRCSPSWRWPVRVILSIYGPAFRQGALWLDIVALACATNCFVGLAETVIMVQRPRINLFNSAITCVIAVAREFLAHQLVRRDRRGLRDSSALCPARHSAPSHLATCLRLGTTLAAMLRRPLIAAVIAAVPAIICRLLLHGLPGQIISAALFLLVFGFEWWFHFRRARTLNDETNIPDRSELGHRPGNCKSAVAKGHEVWGTARDERKNSRRSRTAPGRTRIARPRFHCQSFTLAHCSKPEASTS